MSAMSSIRQDFKYYPMTVTGPSRLYSFLSVVTLLAPFTSGGFPLPSAVYDSIHPDRTARAL
jgi:hypothetical protein